MSSRIVAVAALVLAGAVTTACGAVSSPSAEPSPSAVSPSGPPQSGSAPPKVGPSTPSDFNAGDTISGRVIEGGSGPCYAVVNDDNERFALHNDSGLVLDEGSYITATVAPLRVKIDCGEGTPYALVSFKRQ
ncbi:hypothetical protein [Asanoa iriomotensis]|uniref:Uncharacterized protein n=1 Tax=Asanoa iriomotensis TaxID=234613 RepID=A0ABQ4C554_9ACTN|nr:hypothetical protein [Asanoa iriomotensis]GIF57921.1 hypothetical protein Air01nite_40160 [Asanoa iriomotensis]